MARWARAVRRRWVMWAVPLAIVVGLGVYVAVQFRSVVAVKAADLSYTVPDAPRLQAKPGETVYRIDPTRSQAHFAVDEKIAGATADRVTGTTNGIAGDLAVNRSSPSASRLGEIVVNVEQLRTGNSLRDARIRAAYLSSHDHPLVRFDATSLSGLPPALQDGQTYHFSITGPLTVKTTTFPVTWDATAKVAGGQLTATATTTVKQSTFGIGPISVAGLVSTSDAVTLSFDLVAVDPATATVPTQIAAPTPVKTSGSGPAFSTAVQPILAANCASCHNAGQVGAAHWQLDTAGDAAKVADGIRVVTSAKYMPPWPASDVGVPLDHVKALNPKDIATLAAWAAAGGKLDVPASTPIRPTPGSGGPQPRTDLVLKMPAPYTGVREVPNDYRCFVLDPKFSQPTFITGYRFAADKVPEIHHAQVFLVPADQRAQVSASAGTDGRPGWQCFGGPGLSFTASRGGRAVRGFTGEPGLIAGWAPGQDPVIYPQNAGVLMDPGDVLVLQIHYHYDTQPVPDLSALELQLAPGSSNVRPVQIINPLAPVEIPCMPGDQSTLCDRNAAIADDIQRFGPVGGIEQALLALCRQTVAGLTAGFDGVAHSSCDQRVPESGEIIAVLGHMHTLGKSVRLTLDPGQPGAKVLLDIPTWNFDWQLNYALATPIHVNAGQTVRLECTWDRSLDPNRAQRYIVFAEGTEDEMCFSTYALIPDGS